MNNEVTKITVEHYGITLTGEVPADSTAEELIRNLIYPLLKGIGYSDHTLQKYIIDED